jgi:CubicO group peptidase (beta-lactamase class C family)
MKGRIVGNLGLSALVAVLAVQYVIARPVRAQTPPGATAASSARRAQLEKTILAAMERNAVPGLSVAVIEDGKLDWAEGFGRRVATVDDPVRATTLFQAASISKPVSALAVLVLCEQGQVDLDADVNTRLKSWHVPDCPLLKDRPVTLRKLLSHTAGMTVHGFPGYATNEQQPTLVQILDGAKPANTAAIRVDVKPGYMFRYSGGGYCVAQQLVLDVTGKTFPEFMQLQVLRPLDMSSSSFEQPLPIGRASEAAFGHRAHNALVEGNYHVYPEMAPAGLWTTPSDLAKFVIDLSRSFAHGDGKLLSANMAAQMLTIQKGNYGLGVAVQGEGSQASFSHGGSNEGYRCQMVGYPATGRGLVIMTNSDTGGAVIDVVSKAVAKAYGWP